MSFVFRPVKPPPKLHYTTLSSEAKKTLEDLQTKYSNLLTYVRTRVVSRYDPASYYKSIYNASFKTSQSMKKQDANSKLPEGTHSLKRPFQFSQDVFDKFEQKSSMEHENQAMNNCRFNIKRKKAKPETQVFLEHRPSDEEMAESVLQLTQRTSHPDSPCLDLSCDSEENEQLGDCTSEQTVSRHPNIIHFLDTDCLALSTTDTNEVESHGPVLHNLMSQESPRAARIRTEMETEITDFTSTACKGNIENLDHSAIFSSLDDAGEHVLCTHKCTVSEGNYKQLVKENNNHNYSKVTSKTMDVVDFELKLFDCECSQICDNSQQTHKHIFQNRTKQNAEQDCCSLNNLAESESLLDKEQIVVDRCSSEPVENSLQILISSRHSDDESPYLEQTEASLAKQMKPNVKRTTSVHKKGKLTGFVIQQNSDNLLQNNYDNKEVTHKGKIKNDQCGNSGTKKFKPCFQPPHKAREVINPGPETMLPEIPRKHLNTSLCATPNVVNFSSLSTEEQKKALRSLENSQSLVLTMMYNTSETLMTTFYSAAEHAKRKNSLLQPKVVGIIVLDESTAVNCLFIPSECVCRNDIKTTLFHVLRSESIIKTIANCKEFLIGVHTLCSLKDEHGIACDNLEDPVIACWLVDPDTQPSSFSHMCTTAGVEYRYVDEDWLPYLQMTPKLMHSFRHKLKANKLWCVFTQIEMKLVPVLACMETQTIKVDTALFVKFSDILKSKIKRLEEAVYKEAGCKFTINSHVQLRQILYEKLELDKKLASDVKIIKTDVSNQKSTCESSLQQLAAIHPLPELILEYRQVQKLTSTYVDGMMSCVTNGKIMTHWDQTAASTGRLTSSQPNIQAIPKTVITVKDFQPNYVIALTAIDQHWDHTGDEDSEFYAGAEGVAFPNVRKFVESVCCQRYACHYFFRGSEKVSKFDINAREPFISRPGFVFLAADFQQIELRMLGHLSGDNTLLSLFKQTMDEDVFISLTKQWQNKTSDEVTSADREQTKRVVYSVMYGVGKDKLAEYLKVKPDLAQDIIASFLLQFPAIGSFTKKCWAYTEEFGYTETVSGRRRYFPHINSISPVLRAQALRQAVNFCVQGSAADICKLAMLAVEGHLREKSHLPCRLLLQIHDELIWEVPEEHLLETKGVIQQIIEDPNALCGKLFKLQVPFTVAFSSGKSWAHLNPLV